MSLRINDTAPNFTAKTTQGSIDFHQWIGDQWVILFSHPKDFTPVCTTELGYMAKIEPEFTKRNCKLIGLSVDSVENHTKWEKDIEETQGSAVKYPMIGDTDLVIAKLYNMLPADELAADGRTAANNATCRSVFIIGPDKKIKLTMTYPMTSGRNFDEILRVLESIQLTAKHKVATPANWKQGDDVIIAGSVCAVAALCYSELASMVPVAGSAYTYSYGGQSFYCLNVPALDTTWVYDETFDEWHERAEWNGLYSKWRPTCHSFAYGKHYFGCGTDIYTMDSSVNTYGTGVKRRQRTAPVISRPGRERVFFPSFEVVCEKGTGATLELRWSDDNGYTWSNWHYATVGQIGQYVRKARFSRLGSAYDRVFELVMSDNAPFNPVAVNVPL